MGVPASYVHRPEKQDAYRISSMVQYAKTHTARGEKHREYEIVVVATSIASMNKATGVICDTLKCGEFNDLSAQQYWSIPVKNNSGIADPIIMQNISGIADPI